MKKNEKLTSISLDTELLKSLKVKTIENNLTIKSFFETVSHLFISGSSFRDIVLEKSVEVKNDN
jgi:hypothetical protein